ncbi:hypothetical protein ACH42_06215 [Endozoicomonas sp. (ex Bugula neritina AB1)]|nr:hypothetical protein ACH42_06215 [Endozoicomonas sp. (ex Bugula neritina AB1)]
MTDCKKNVQGTYLSIDDLMHLRSQVKGVRISPRLQGRGIRQGQYSSRQLGRGGQFEEIRQYAAGDDVRNIDWNVTARHRTPYVRSYCEEREQKRLLVLDQRSSMFFGSSLMMKSYGAASLAAHLIWADQQANNRTGVVVFNDHLIEATPARQGLQHLGNLFGIISQFNNSLSSDISVTDNPDMLNQALDIVQQHQKQHCQGKAQIIVISDFSGFSETTCHRMAALNSHHSVIAVQVYDSLLDHFPESGYFTAINDSQTARLNMANPKVRGDLLNALTSRISSIRKQLNQVGVFTTRLHTGQSVTDQFHAMVNSDRLATES